MSLVYNVFGKQFNEYNKNIKESKVITYKISKEEIKEKYGDISPINKISKSSKGYDRQINQKFRRMYNQKGNNTTKEYWTISKNKMYK